MLSSLALRVIAQSLNQYLKMDPEIKGRLKKYNGKVVRFNIRTIDWSFFIIIDNEQLRLQPEYKGPLDASVIVSISDLIKNAINQKISFSETMELHGDSHLVQELISIFKSVEIDWEELIAHCTGDAIAHEIGNLFRKVKTFHEDIFETQKLNVKEYLQEEIQLLIHPFAIEDFCKDVEEFRENVDRLTARIIFIRDKLEKD